MNFNLKAQAYIVGGMDDELMQKGRDGQREGLRDQGRDVWIINGCLKRHEEEEVMQVFYSLNNEFQNILNMINDRWLPWQKTSNINESPRYSIY